MADGAQRTQWGHTAAIMMTLQKVWTGTGPPLVELIPQKYRDEATEDLTPEEEEAQSALAFAELEAGLKALSRQMEPQIAGFKGK